MFGGQLIDHNIKPSNQASQKDFGSTQMVMVA